MARGLDDPMTGAPVPTQGPSNVRRKLGVSLKDAYPDVAALWHPTRNRPWSPETIDAHASRIVWWKCVHGHETKASVYHRTARALTCPKCNGRSFTLAEAFPILCQQWDTTRNGSLTPDQVSMASRKHDIWWTCPYGHESYQKTAHQRTSQHQGCPICAEQRRQGHGNKQTLRRAFPRLADEWVKQLNGPIKRAKANDRRTLSWRCPSGHVYQATIDERTRHNVGCPWCAKTGSDASLPAEIAHEWHVKRNGPLSAITRGSTRKVWWICSTDPDHRWQATVVNRTTNKTGCPHCARTSSHPPLAVGHPDIAAQWDDTANGEPLPATLSSGSSRIAVWRCEQGHLWQTRVSHRALDGMQCQVCNDNRNLDTFRHFLSENIDEIHKADPDHLRDLFTLAGTLQGQGAMRTLSEAILTGEIDIDEIRQFASYQASDLDIVLAEHDPAVYGGRPAIPDAVRQFVYERDGYACQNPYCKTQPDSALNRISLDHDLAYVWGGGDEASNLRTLCIPCNSRKGVRSWSQFVADESAADRS